MPHLYKKRKCAKCGEELKRAGDGYIDCAFCRNAVRDAIKQAEAEPLDMTKFVEKLLFELKR